MKSVRVRTYLCDTLYEHSSDCQHLVSSDLAAAQLRASSAEIEMRFSGDFGDCKNRERERNRERGRVRERG